MEQQVQQKEDTDQIIFEFVPDYLMDKIREMLNIERLRNDANGNYQEHEAEVYDKVMMWLERNGMYPTTQNIEQNKKKITKYVNSYSLEDIDNEKDLADEMAKGDTKMGVGQLLFFLALLGLVYFIFIKR